ncbi:phage tail tube assembly chaperone [uncultured Aquimarina sp.]|uniref:phage tail tube assembly chaperone n=1 Tax=uncultured Aquimarina sp. TaxID=575652 RepID=UPI0026390FCA|nr:phage tail tube assembly chaperone [uncultured Aquimarina sp.]
MSKKVFKNKMNGLSDDELMHVLENSNKYQKDAIDAVIDIAKSRGLEISKFQQEIEKERVEEIR